MNKVAAHDSGTGEKSKNLLHRLFEPFAKTQTKAIKEQFDSGCRYFDLRVDKDYNICHGLWKANKTLFDILSELEWLSSKSKDKVYYTITVERNFKGMEDFIVELRNLVFNYSFIECVCINRKRPKWETIYKFIDIPIKADYVSVPTPEQYKKFNFKNWKKYIPIPKVLHNMYKRKYQFNEKYFVMVDFL